MLSCSQGFFRPAAGPASGIRQDACRLAATLDWYQAPQRLADALADMADTFGAQPAAVTLQLTKRFEEIRARGPARTVASQPPENFLNRLFGQCSKQCRHGSLSQGLSRQPQ
jgi:16S rRNA C1402 (ribose-2'-O) methylase RsmI